MSSSKTIILIIFLSFTQLSTGRLSRVKRQACRETRYPSVFYVYGFLDRQMRPIRSESLDDCADKCFERPMCEFLNYIESTGDCFLLREGISSTTNLDYSKFVFINGAYHVYINCGRITSYPDPSARGVPTTETTPARPTTPIPSVKCGIQAPQFMPSLPTSAGRQRIINGDTAKEHSWPWLLSLENKLTATQMALCGADLIRLYDNVEASDIAVTAAHCVLDNNGNKEQGSILTIIAGRHDRQGRSPYEERRRVIEYRARPDFDPTTVRNDLAILKLSDPIHFSDAIRPICLPSQDEQLPLKQTCVIAGWGRDKEEDSMSTSRYLQQSMSPVRDDKTCKKGWGKYYSNASMICSGALDGKSGSCNGDSGGMLVCQQSETSPWTLYGITSYGIAESCLSKKSPSVFTRVSSYVNFITQNALNMTSLNQSGFRSST